MCALPWLLRPPPVRTRISQQPQEQQACSVHSSVATATKSECRRATCSKVRPILTRWQIVNMIYEHFHETGAYDAVQGLSDLFIIRSQKDDVQDFDVRWDQALLSASETPIEMVLEGLYKSKLQDSGQLQTVIGFV